MVNLAAPAESSEFMSTSCFTSGKLVEIFHLGCSRSVYPGDVKVLLKGFSFELSP